MMFNFVFIEAIDIVKNYEELVNYSGKVRGASQRAVKNALLGKRNEYIIREIDEFLISMSQEKEENLVYINNSHFKQKLKEIINDWNILKKELSKFTTEQNKKKLYEISENFVDKTDSFVITINDISKKQMVFFNYVKISLILVSLCVMIILFWQTNRYINLKENVKFLNELAYRDKSTGLPNRRSYDLEIEKYSHMKKLPDLLCIAIDLNNLKYFNDTYGHFVGDRMIELFGNLLKEKILPYGFACRLGGDEFMILVEHCNNNKLYKIIDLIDQNLEIINSKEQIINIAYSWGAVISSEIPNLRIYDIIHLADQRMYDFKRNNKMVLLKA